MNKTKLLGSVIATAIAMTGMCAEISHNVITHTNTAANAKTSESLCTAASAKDKKI
ncbi:MAG: hypothetical protein IJX24_07630 [Oscillospiraceae bacterium]|nr:hypothetical protein [Oscillospiraceae bacterium]